MSEVEVATEKRPIVSRARMASPAPARTRSGKYLMIFVDDVCEVRKLSVGVATMSA